MRLLILGGTAWLGGAVARHALAAGMDTTCLARGSTPLPPGAWLVRADRDQPDALAEVGGITWDAVLDLTRQPGHARRAAQQLRARHWVLVSSASVYAHFDQPAQGEESATLDPLTDDVMADMSAYGPAKVACEQAVLDARESFTIVRAGLIGGAGDWSGRSGYYPWRFRHPTGADVLVPPDLGFPTALIDVEDLAAWLVHCAAERVPGVFNATGPTIALGEHLEVARTVAQSSAAIRPASAQALWAAGVSDWMGPMSLPLWIDDPLWRYFATLDTSRARAEGLLVRPLADTLAAALDYEESRGVPRQAGLTDDEERRLRHLLES